MKKLIFATGNENKVREIKMIMADMDYEIISLKEAGIEVDIEEDGMTFEENAVIKATVISKMTGELVLADDSGLEVDYLNKQPGIYSARYEGVDTPYTIKNQIIIDRLEGVAEEQRTARFVCAIAAAFPDGRVLTRTAAMEGRIDYEQKGENGFGYDPIFYLPQFGCTSAQLSPEHKNAISHRGKALRMMREALLAEDRNALNMEDIPSVPIENATPAAGEQETESIVSAVPNNYGTGENKGETV